MKQWDIFSYAFSEGEHPAVIVSPDEQCLNPDVSEVNVLFCASHRPIQREVKRFEVILDQTDGLDWRTAVRCHRFLLVRKEALRAQRGRVCAARQREIGRKIVEVFRLPL
jgi:mRNA-degrading endonuclease toxin of MazEF toxin-antitoxin module